MGSVLVRWCRWQWLAVTYLIGLALIFIATLHWNDWSTPKRLLCVLAILLPLHVFEENTYPNGFHYQINTIQGSQRPNVGPLNTISNMVTNFGAEMLFITLFIWGGNMATCILIAFFGIGESVIHTMFGVLMRKRSHCGDIKGVYGPGLLSAYFALLPLSIYAVFWMNSQMINVPDIAFGILLIILVIVLFIRAPVKVLGKYQPEYAFDSSGYYGRRGLN